MADYIDKEQLLEEYESYGNMSPIALTFIDYLKEMPSVDAVKVVRCKDCRYHYDNGNHMCRKLSIVLPDDSEFFCKYGKE